MAVSKQEVIIEFDADTGQAEKNIQDLEKSTEGVGKAAEKSALGFRAVGTAIKATGIGLLVALLAKLVEKFSENKKVADGFAVAGAALGTIFNDLIEFGTLLAEKLFNAFSDPKQALTDFADLIKENISNRFEGLLKLIPRLGEAIGLLFKGEFKEAGKVAVDAVAQVTLGVTDFTDKVSQAADAVVEYAQGTAEAVKQATALERQLQKLNDAERDLAVTTAQSRAEVEELKRQRDDQTLSIEERIAAAEKAAAIDKAIADENVRIAEEKAALLRQEIELQGETEERLQAVADAEIAAADARTASATVQTELQNSLFALNEEARAKQEEQAAREAEEAQAEQDAFLERLKKRKEAKDKAAAEDKERAERLAAQEKRIEEQKRDVRDKTIQALADLNEAFAGETEEQQKKAFERGKKIAIAQTLISTYESATAAFKSVVGIPVIGPGLATAAALAATATGLANVKRIKSQEFQAGGTEGGTSSTSSPSPSLSGAATQATQAPQAPQLDLSFLGEGAVSEAPIQAYVISQDVSNAQQANQQIQEQAQL